PKEQLEQLAKFAVRIGVRYEHGAVRSLITGSGMIIGECVITVAHLFNPIELDEQNEIVPYSRIMFTTTTLASVSWFMSDHDEDIFEAEMIVRGSNGLKPLDICSRDDDFAILRICHIENVSQQLFSEIYQNYPRRITGKEQIQIDSPLFLLSYCSLLNKNEDINFYEGCSHSTKYTRENLITAMHPEHLSVSLGKCLTIDDNFIRHDCPSLKGASGGVLVNKMGRLVCIHTGVTPSDIYYNKQGEKRLVATALNQALPLYSNLFKSLVETNIQEWK
ncbi:unnamed protein product, partial [Didymodactylos carnosus]